MQIKLFTIPTMGGEKLNEELNVFLRSKKILQVQKEFHSNTTEACWCFCISYVDNITMASRTKAKIDYKEVLDKASFERFSSMRLIRKKLSQDEGLPAYAIFTDAEMAALAKIPDLDFSKMKKIKGIGEKKIEKYGKHFLLKEIDEKTE